MAYPNLQYPINLSSGTYQDYKTAGRNWCKQRKVAKGNYRAYQLLREWGFARQTGTETCFDGQCGNYDIWNSDRVYCINSNIINAQEARRLAVEFADGDKERACEIIENMYGEAIEQHKRVVGELDDAKGSEIDNLEIAKHKWGVVKDYMRAFRMFQGGTYEDGEVMDTCPEEGIQYIYDEAGDRFQSKIDEEGAPIPDSLLIGLIGAGTILLSVIIYRVTR